MSWLDHAISLTLPAVPRPIVRYFSRPYIAGTTAEDAVDVVRSLEREGAMATLDILGEFITTLDEAERNTSEYVDLLNLLGDKQLQNTYVSVKLTALGLLIDRHRCVDNMRRLLGVASRIDSFVRIDMEDSACTTPTLEIFETLRAEYPNRIGAVLQSRLRRTLDDVDAVTEEPANIRLCKGIYLEPREIAWTDPEIIRRSFVESLDLLFERGAYVGIATHDEQLVWEAQRLIHRHGLARERYEFQMLLGVDEQLRRILLDAGHRLRVYVPYGERWYQYSVRRLRENPQIAGYAFKALFQRTPTPSR